VNLFLAFGILYLLVVYCTTKNIIVCYRMSNTYSNVKIANRENPIENNLFQIKNLHVVSMLYRPPIGSVDIMSAC